MTKIQLRRDTAANWSTNNPTPSAGEPCFEIDTHKFKIGDGITKYTNLPYQGGDGLEICDIGISLYVDETKGLRRYLNGQVVDINTNTQAFLDKLKQITTLHPSLLCTEEEWQTAKTMSAFGQVGKFVFNYSGDEIVSVRLPRVVNVQGLFDLQNLGMTVDAGLPNVIGRFAAVSDAYNPTGAFTPGGGTGANFSAGTYDYPIDRYYDFNASKSNPIYGNSDTVQQEAIQYPYFIQIATGSETENNIINEIELNNPYSLFDSKYSDHELNNLSWLKSEGQWNAKAVYTDAYDKLLKVYNGTETVEGLSVKLSTETYTDYDFVLNTTDETFRLPVKVKQKFLNAINGNMPVVGNGMTLGLTNGTVNYGLLPNGGQNPLIGTTKAYGLKIGVNGSGGRATSGTSTLGITTDPTKSGLVAKLSQSEVSDLYLYFYVGETVQNANLIDAGRIGEVLATKTDMLQASGAGIPSDKYIDLTLGASGSTYTAPANGWYHLAKIAGNAGLYISIYNNVHSSYQQAHSTADPLSIMFEVQKGTTITITYNATGATNSFRFIYAEGSSPTV